MLWLIDFILDRTLGAGSTENDSMTVATFVKWKRQRVIRRVVTFASSWLLFLATTVPFVVDMLLVRLRSMRFTFELVAMTIEDSSLASALSVSSYEYTAAYETVATLAGTLFDIHKRHLADDNLKLFFSTYHPEVTGGRQKKRRVATSS